MKSVAVVPAALALVLMTGCASTSVPMQAEKPVIQAPEVVAEVEPKAIAAPADPSMLFPELQGNWRGQCSPMDPQFPEEGYVISTFAFTGNNFMTNTVVYSDKNCSATLKRGIAQSGSTMQSMGSLSRPAGQADTSMGRASFVDIKYERFTIDDKPIDASMAQFFAARTLHSIIFIDGNRFLLGDDSGRFDGSTPQLRPTGLKTETTYTRE